MHPERWEEDPGSPEKFEFEDSDFEYDFPTRTVTVSGRVGRFIEGEFGVPAEEFVGDAIRALLERRSLS